jgi:fructose transport system ATP-binding protein
MTTVSEEVAPRGDPGPGTPVLSARDIWKSYGRVVALRGVDIDVYPGEVLGLVGDNGAGKSTLIKCISGAEYPDSGTIFLEGEEVVFHGPLAARHAGIEVVHQTLGVAPQLDITSNLYLGREIRKRGVRGKVLRMLDVPTMRRQAGEKVKSLGIVTIQDITQAVETLSGGQRQAVAVARAAAFGSKVLIMDEPTAALGVRESGQVHQLIGSLRDSGLPIVLISHNMPALWDLANRVAILRLGRMVAILTPETSSMEEAVAIMTGAKAAPSPLPSKPPWGGPSAKGSDPSRPSD